MSQQNLSEEELNKVALKKSFDDFYAKTGKNPMTNQEEAMQHHNKIQQNEPLNLHVEPQQEVKPTYAPPKTNFNPENVMQQQMKETDPDLIVDTDVVKLPSDGHFYLKPQFLKETL